MRPALPSPHLRSWARLAAGAAALSAAVATAHGCGGDEPATTGTGGCAPGACGGGDAGPEPPDCRGTPIPKGDLEVDPDGRTLALACPGVSIRATVIDEGVVRLRYRGTGAASDRPSYAITGQPSAAAKPIFGSTAITALICTSELLIRIDRKSCLVRADHADGTPLVEEPEGGGYVEGQEGSGAEDRAVVRRALPGERFYGFGERTGPLDKRGRAMTFWNTDAFQAAYGGYPPDADPLYQSIPFFIGLRGAHAYGIFVDGTRRMRFDMAASDPSEYRLAAAGGEIDSYLVAGPAMSDVVERYTALTGRTPLPPRWTLGYHQSRWGYSPDTEVLAVAQEFRTRKIPADGIWLDIQHMNGFRSWTWDPATFPDPKGMVDQLSAIGFEAVAIVDPGVKVDPGWDVYDSGLAGGHFLMKGPTPYVGEVWPGAAVFPDFSAPETRAWWASLVPRTLGAGVRGLWIDMNEPSNFVAGEGGTVPGDLPAAGDGAPGTMAELHNVYGLNEARATFEGMRAAAPDRRPFLLTRAGYAGTQRYAAVWTGDAPSTWPTLETTLPMMLGMGLSGIPFVGSDVGGYSGGATPELFARWMQLGSFSPFFRGHVQTGVNAQEPWQFGTEVEDISRSVISQRYELLPYLYSLFDEARRTGAPILRPLVYAFQSDSATHDVSDEAMLGPWLLVAPALAQGITSRDVYLPEGRWFERRSGAIHEGPETITADLTLGALPTYVRAGAIIPRAPLRMWSDEAPIDVLYLDLYPAEEETSFALYEDAGDSLAHESGAYSRVTYTLAGSAAGATLRASAREGSFAPPPRLLVARARRVDHGVSAVRLGGAPLPAFATYDELLAAGHGYWYDDRDLSLVVASADGPGIDLEMDYDPAISSPAPPVMMPFEVKVPPGTPVGTPIHIATSASGWAHTPLAWGPGADTASGLVSVPRGAWLFYKYTRGSWATVEKWPGCVEASNRYELGAAWPVKRDTVFAWADACP